MEIWAVVGIDNRNNWSISSHCFWNIIEDMTGSLTSQSVLLVNYFTQFPDLITWRYERQRGYKSSWFISKDYPSLLTCCLVIWNHFYHDILLWYMLCYYFNRRENLSPSTHLMLPVIGCYTKFVYPNLNSCGRSPDLAWHHQAPPIRV